MSHDAPNDFNEPFWTFCQAPNELKTWQNVQNGSIKPFGASQLIMSEKTNDFFRSEWAQNLTKRSERLIKVIWSIMAHSEREKL